MRWIKNTILSCFGGCEMLFVDLNKTKTIWYKWYKKETFSFRGKNKIYVIDPAKMKNKICLYHSQFAEPLTLEYSDTKTDYFISSKEFARTYNNKLLTMMLYVQAKDLIKYILYISIFVLLCSGFSAYTLYDMTSV